MKKLTKEEYISKAEFKHKKYYSYGNLEYNGASENVTITCPNHGDFSQKAANHLNGQRCPKCVGKFMDKEFFIEKSIKKHGIKYNYDKILYEKSNIKVEIFCNYHQEYFWQTPNKHLNGRGCQKCGKKIKSDPINEGIKREKQKLNELNVLGKQKNIIIKFILVHGEKYNYDRVIFRKMINKVEIFCNYHKKYFWQRPVDHINGQGCPKCSKIRIQNLLQKDLSLVIKNFVKVHNDKYNYNKIKYINGKTPVEIFCNYHQEYFWQSPNTHGKGSGCPKCSKLNRNTGVKTTSSFIKEASKIYSENEYNYDRTKYINAKHKIEIGCNKCQEYFIQIPHKHLQGQGCPKCNTIGGVSELKLYNFLKITFPNIFSQFKDKWLRSFKIGGSQSLDLYLKEYNIGIEYQGEHHFKPILFFGGEKRFIRTLEEDGRKRLLCEANSCKLFYFTYKSKTIPADYPHKVYTDEQELKQAIEDHILSLQK